jgi:hypothetical protein
MERQELNRPGVATTQVMSRMQLMHVIGVAHEANYCQKFSIYSSHQAPSYKTWLLLTVAF